MNLTDAQQRAVDSDSPLILCCAGAGAGKTKTLTERIRRLVLAMHDPAGMVAITFTNAAADELKDRLEGITLQYVGTLHGYMLRLIQAHGSKIGFNGPVGVLDEDQAQALLDQVVKDLAYRGTKKDLEAALKGGIGKILSHQTTVADMVAAAFFRRLRQANLVTFDTILEYGLKLAGYATGEYLFCDEVQDSSALDFAIYHAMPFANKFMVGDQDQQIFSFRGASDGFLDIARRLPHSLIRLEENFRSDRLICSAANRLIEHNQNRIKKVTVSVSDAGGTVEVVRHRNASAELSWLADLLSDQDGPSCAVLARSNALVDSVTQHLTGLGIAVARRQKPERPQDWETARALLLVLNDPENDLLAGWLLARHAGADHAAVVKLEATAQGQSLNQRYLKLPAVTAVADVPTVMARAGVSREAVGFVEELIGRTAPETISELLLGLAADDQKERQVSPGIVVTTVHKAKGTEYDTVVIVGCEEPGFPTGQAIKSGPEAVEECRRVAFVAMTRARHSLYLSHCDSRVPEWGPKVGQPRQPSRFIKEAGL